MDEFGYEHEVLYAPEDWEFATGDSVYEDDPLDANWPADPFSLPYETTSWAATEPGGCFFPWLLPPAMALFLGGLFALWLLSQPANPLAKPPANSAALQVPLSQEQQTPARGKLSPVFTAGVQYWRADIVRWARQWNVDPNLVATIMQIESCGNPQALSRAGAMGLFQVMPYHFQASENPYDPDTNARRGLGYLRRALDAFANDARMAFAGYNGGIGGASRGETLWAGETVRYVYWGTGIYHDALSGKRKSARLEEWLQAGGASLCFQAEQALGIR